MKGQPDIPLGRGCGKPLGLLFAAWFFAAAVYTAGLIALTHMLGGV